MANYIVLTGRTEILAAIYDEKNLPSAILCEDKDGSAYPACLHGLREADLTTTEQLLVIFGDKLGLEHKDRNEKVRARLYPFFEDYPLGQHTCMGCYFGHERGVIEEYHDIEETERHARKLCEDCA